MSKANKNIDELIVLMRQLVSDAQGAPFPGAVIEPELYTIWYEHTQRSAQSCFEFLEQHFPMDNSKFNDTLDSLKI